MSATNQTPEQVAKRFGRSLQWAKEHIGSHYCVDGRRYEGSCLVSDPRCENSTRYFLART
jgi:hypothetical protein